MQPVQLRSKQTAGAGMMVILICVVIAGALTLGGWAYWNKKYKTPGAEPGGKPAAAKAPAAATEQRTVLTTNNNPLARASKTLGAVRDLNQEGDQTATAMQTPAKAAPQPAEVIATSPAAAPVNVARPATASGPKLQAIIFRPINPSAVINGKTVGVGEEVDGMKVLEIQRQSVRVQIGSEIRELRMNVKR